MGDALSDVFFSLAAGSEDASSEPFDTSTESLSLSAMVEMEKGCSAGWSGLVESVAPGCLGQCTKYGICNSIGKVIGVWSRTHSKGAAKAKACESKRAFDCLLWSSHRKTCQPLIDRALRYQHGIVELVSDGGDGEGLLCGLVGLGGVGGPRMPRAVHEVWH